jgi:hypothetical protein
LRHCDIVGHKQGECAPATAKLKDALAVAQAGMTDRVLKREGFGLRQRFIAFGQQEYLCRGPSVSAKKSGGSP